MDGSQLDSLKMGYKLNDLVIRHLIITTSDKYTDAPPMVIAENMMVVENN